MRRKRMLWLCLFLAALLPATAFALPSANESADAVCVIEADSGMQLMAQNAEEALAAAGLMRLPALLIVCEAADAGELDLTTQLPVSESAATIGGPTAFLSRGEHMLAGDLMKSAVMITAGDALYALSEAVCASDEVFLARVNDRLKALAVSVSYSSRLGAETRLSALDAARIGAALSKSRTFLTYSGLYYDTVTHDSGLVTEMASANKLLKSCSGCVGGVTGSSQDAGYCGVYMVERDGVCYVCAVFDAVNAKERAQIAKEAVEYTFASYSVERLARRGDVIVRDIPVKGGTAAVCDLIALEDVSVVMPADGNYTEKSDIPSELTAPLRAGSVLGGVTYLDADGGILAQVQLTVSEDMEAARLYDRLQRVLYSFLHVQ